MTPLGRCSRSDPQSFAGYQAEPGRLGGEDLGQRPEGPSDEVHLQRVRIPVRGQLCPAVVLA